MSNVFTTGAMDVRQPDGSFKSTHVLIGNTKESIDAVNAKKDESIAAVNAIKEETLTEINRVKETIPEDYSRLSVSIVEIENTGESKVPSGKVWTTTENGAEWKTPTGGGSEEDIKNAVNKYLDENPVQPYDDTEVKSKLNEMDDLISGNEKKIKELIVSDESKSTENTKLIIEPSDDVIRLISEDDLTPIVDELNAIKGSLHLHDFVLIGKITNDNKDTGLSVDLSGKTEIVIRSRIEGTGNATITANGRLLADTAGINGTRHSHYRFKTSQWGYDCVDARYNNNAGAFPTTIIGNIAIGWSCFDGRKISDINKFAFNIPANVTNAYVEIYAR